jgi:hypothetical protein
LFVSDSLFFLEGLVMSGVTGADKYAVRIENAEVSIVRDCAFNDCSNGIYISNSSAKATLREIGFNTSTIFNMSRGINIQAGNVVVKNVRVINSADIDTLLIGSGQNSIITANDIISFSDSIDVGMYFSNKTRVSGLGHRFVAANDGIVLSGDSVDVRFDATQIFNSTNDAVRIESTGTNPRLGLFSFTIDDSESLNLNILNSTATILGDGFTNLDKVYIKPGTMIYTSILDDKSGDEGLNVLGELRVGIPEVPTESAFGGGDSYTRGMLVYTYNGSTYTNVTDSAVNVDGFNVKFPNVNVNTAIYMTSTLNDSLIHHGLKVYMEDSMTIGSGEVLSEYWNGSTWTEFNCMVTDGDEPFLPYAKQYFEQNGSTHIRYDITMTNDDWIANDPPSLGNNHKWVRYRIATAITESPKIDQIKLHTNRYEFNSDGFGEGFGNARNRQLSELNIGAGEPFEGNMQSQTIYVDQDIGVGFQTNRFTATADKLGYPINFADNVDTSSPFTIVWSGRSAAAGSITWTIRYKIVSPDDVLYTTEPTPSGTSGTVTVTQTISLGTNELFTAEIDISKAIPRRQSGFGDQIWISIQPSTLPGSFDLTNIGAAFWTWSEGGHW